MTIDALEGLEQADARSGLEKRIREAVLTDPPTRTPDSGLLERPGQSGREKRNRGADFEAVLTDPLQGFEKADSRSGLGTDAGNQRSKRCLPIPCRDLTKRTSASGREKRNREVCSTYASKKNLMASRTYVTHHGGRGRAPSPFRRALSIIEAIKT